MPLRTPLSVSRRTPKCRYLINLLHPLPDNLRLLLRNSTQPGDAELLQILLTEPSALDLPWGDLSSHILKRIVELHWEEHYAAWGVKKVLCAGENGKILAHFAEYDDN
ncbi:hypothetical protein FRC12_000347 [Ceratobasidium sp. 428]|nr:hypothetical protein FRC12_000347 [Ceratobasidium sp. 428]